MASERAELTLQGSLVGESCQEVDTYVIFALIDIPPFPLDYRQQETLIRADRR